MIIGVPKEIKNNENRVGVVPAGVQLLVQNGHQVWVQSGCGVGSGFEDRQYEKAGATVLEDAAKVWAAEMVIKVKEPLGSEYPYLREDLILFTYLHLAAAPELTKAMLQAGMTAIGYETMVGKKGDLPLLSKPEI